jgi:hypothetical protein
MMLTIAFASKAERWRASATATKLSPDLPAADEPVAAQAVVGPCTADELVGDKRSWPELVRADMGRGCRQEPRCGGCLAVVVVPA